MRCWNSNRGEEPLIPPDALSKKAPLSRFVFHRLRQRPIALALAAFVYYLVFLPLAGLYVQASYDQPFIGLFEQDELVNAAVSFLLVAPSIWWFYGWQLRSVPRLYINLQKNGVIDQPEGTQTEESMELFFEQAVARPMTRSWLHGLALAIAIAAEVVFSIARLREKSVGIPRWFEVYNWLFFIFYIPPAILTVYAMILAAIRQIVVVRSLSSAFRAFRVTVHPLHPDQVGGFGPLGGFAVRSGILGFLLGTLANVVVFSPVLFGKPPVLSLDCIALYVAYLLVAPALVVSPIISARRAMRKAKRHELERVSRAYDLALSRSQRQLSYLQPEAVQAENKILEQLAERHRHIVETHPTLPFSIMQRRGLGLSGILSLLPSLALFIAEAYLTFMP